jgi:hypothetical protein
MIGVVGVSSDKEASMMAYKKTSIILLASTFALALAIDTAEARRGGGGAGVRAGGGGARMSAAGVRGGFNRAHVSQPIAGRGRLAVNRPGWGGGNWAGNRPGYGGGGYRPGYGWGAAAVAGAVGAGLAYSNCYDGSCGGYYNTAYDDGYYGNSGGYATTSVASDAVAYCAQRFRSYDLRSQTYLARNGQRVSP